MSTKILFPNRFLKCGTFIAKKNKFSLNTNAYINKTYIYNVFDMHMVSTYMPVK